MGHRRFSADGASLLLMVAYSYTFVSPAVVYLLELPRWLTSPRIPGFVLVAYATSVVWIKCKGKVRLTNLQLAVFLALGMLAGVSLVSAMSGRPMSIRVMVDTLNWIYYGVIVIAVGIILHAHWPRIGDLVVRYLRWAGVLVTFLTVIILARVVGLETLLSGGTGLRRFAALQLWPIGYPVNSLAVKLLYLNVATAAAMVGLERARVGARLIAFMSWGAALLIAFAFGSRQAVGGLVLIVAALGCVQWAFGERPRRKRWLLWLGVAVLAAAVGLMSLSTTDISQSWFMDRFIRRTSEEIIEGSGRMDLYKAALSDIARRPLLGYGPGSFLERYGTDPHSTYLGIGATLGVPALGLTVYALLIPLASSIVSLLQGPSRYSVLYGVAIASCGVVILWTFQWDWLIHNLEFWILFGMLLYVGGRAVNRGRRNQSATQTNTGGDRVDAHPIVGSGGFRYPLRGRGDGRT